MAHFQSFTVTVGAKVVKPGADAVQYEIECTAEGVGYEPGPDQRAGGRAEQVHGRIQEAAGSPRDGSGADETSPDCRTAGEDLLRHTCDQTERERPRGTHIMFWVQMYRTRCTFVPKNEAQKSRAYLIESELMSSN